MDDALKNLKGKKVLVTGGCGFIGHNLVVELLTKGAHPTVLDLPSTDWQSLPKNVAQIKADILDMAALRNKLDNFDIIYHLAARTDLDGKNLDDYKVNYTGTKNLIEAAAGSKNLKRFVFYSTQLVVGLFNETRFIDEAEPYKTNTIYGLSKIEGEKAVKRQCKGSGIAYTIIRPTSVYGQRGKAPYLQFFQAIKAGRYFHVGKANNLVSMVYVKNLVDLTLLASVSNQARNQIFFGNDFHPYTMRELVNAAADYYGVKIRTVPSLVMAITAYGLGILKAFGLNVPIYPSRLKNIQANYCYDIQKSINIGYRPRYGLTEGIKETLDWYESAA
jgi:nucleoside-diphosphate-sugar epimerase